MIIVKINVKMNKDGLPPVQTGRETVFFLSSYAARQSGILKRFRVGENGEGLAELWAVSRHKALRAKNLVSTRFFTLFNQTYRKG